jgi:hypothetical protein
MTKEHFVLLHWLSLLLPQAICAAVNDDSHVSSDTLATCGHRPCRNPTLAKCEGEAQHFQSWGFEALRDSRMFRVR